MKKKLLLPVIAFSIITSVTSATDSKRPEEEGGGSSLQQVFVSTYYHGGGYEYASRIKRFHTSYVTFDFYSPMYTEVYWYRYTPYTWGVSIYDDWHYYGRSVARDTWTSGFGGSYWWGYEPWWGSSRGIGYGWSSWYSPGFSYSVNYYLGRPHYHYPVAWSGWHSHRYISRPQPLTVINYNTYNYYYGSEKRVSSQGGSAGYNPPDVSATGRRAGYTSTGGRSAALPAPPAPVSTQPATGNSGTSQPDADKDKSNNGLRMGQHRRGVAEPAAPGDNGLPRTNNPNVDDRINPGREQNNRPQTSQGRQTGIPQEPGTRRTVKYQANDSKQTDISQGTAGQRTVTSQGTAGQQTDRSRGTTVRQSQADRAPARTSERQQVQGSVRSTTRRDESATQQVTNSGASRTSETTSGKESGKEMVSAPENASGVNKTGKTTTSSRKKR